MLKWARVADRDEKRLVPNDCLAVFAIAKNKLKETITASAAQVTSGPLPTVLAGQADRDDWPELVLLFENLIGNALKYRAADRPPRVHIEAHRQGAEWLFSVQDNGIGIEPQYFDRIFELFKRLHSESKFPGHGIGLAYCQRVVQSLGGKIWVESEYGKGSTFYFTLPPSADHGASEQPSSLDPAPDAVRPVSPAPTPTSQGARTQKKKHGAKAKPRSKAVPRSGRRRN